MTVARRCGAWSAATDAKSNNSSEPIRKANCPPILKTKRQAANPSSLNSGALRLDHMAALVFPTGFFDVSISTSPAVPDTVEIVRFLHRFSDLMSTGTNSDNLLRAARLLETHVDMVRETNELLQAERIRGDAGFELHKALEDRIGGLESEIAVLTSQLSEQQVTLSEVIADAESRNAQLLQRAEEAEARLAAIQDRPTAADSSDGHVLVPIAALRLAEAQFLSLARAFERSGNIVSQVMCEASASSLDRTILDAGASASADRSKHAA